MMMPHNLPVVPTPFVGRSHDTEAIQGLLADPTCRLLTLVGPGGIGKTRLALHILQQMVEQDAPDDADGIYFIPLQSACTPSQIVTAIAEELGFNFFQGDNAQKQLLDFLCTKRLFLLMDNLEHLLDSIDIISTVLAHAPGVRIMATSREALNLQEEWVYTVGGMRVPSPDDLESFESFSAVRLFVQSARRVHPGFSLEHERAGIARICELVGGMPLGLELAAAWVRALSCDEIADEIARNMSILETSARNVPERHRTMRGVLAQSWALLSAEEQQVMMRLAVFQGGFTREAAEAATGASPRVLSALVDKSWLRWNSDDRQYDIHELLRQHASEQLVGCGLEDVAREAHANYFAGWTQKREGEIKFQRQDAALEDMECQFANVRAAWLWATSTQNIDLTNQMIEGMNFFCDMRARFGEGEELFQQASELFTNSDDPQKQLTFYRLRLRRARMIQNSLTYMLQELNTLLIELETIREALKAFNSPIETALTLYQIGFAKAFRDDSEVSAPYFAECVRIFTEADDPFYKADALHLLGTSTNDFLKAKAYYKEAYYIQQAIGDRNGMSWSLTQLARSSYTEHQYETAASYSDSAAIVQRERKDWKGLHFNLLTRSSWDFRRGHTDAAISAAEESVRVARAMNMIAPLRGGESTLGLILILTERDVEHGQQLCLRVMSSTETITSATEADIDALNGLAIAAYLQNDPTTVRVHYDHLVDHLPRIGMALVPTDLMMNLGTSAILVLDSQGQTELAIEITAQMSSVRDEPCLPAIDWLKDWPLLNRLRTKWEAELGTEAYAEAWERGKGRSVEQTITFFTNGLNAPDEPTSSTSTSSDLLTAREHDVLVLLAGGLSNREIAEQLVFSVGTVKWYVNQIYSKLDVGSRTQAVARARELNLLH